MGTVYKQEPRRKFLEEEQVIAFADMISNISEESKITYIEALETYKALALINDYDAKDEQIAGIAEILASIKDR